MELKHVNPEIENVLPFCKCIAGVNVKVVYELAFTMVDGKVKNAITNTKSAMRCYIRQATLSQFNNIDDMLGKATKKSHHQFGMSTLHAWIRFMEWFLHLSYEYNSETDEKHWQNRDKEMNEHVKCRKTQIQEKFRKETGLSIDFPKPGGGTMSYGFDIDAEKFRNFCLGTARRYVELYKWYPIPTSCHIILIHGADIIESLSVLLRILSEDAQGARNKDIKYIREHNFRKSSR